MRFASLGSGSRGNAAIVQAGETTLMVDCGFSLRQATQRLRALGLELAELDGILVTHEHADHIQGVERVARAADVPVWMSAGTWLAGRLPSLAPERLRIFDAHAAFSIGDVEVMPLPVPHDAREPTQFMFSDGQRRLAMVTDLGSSTPWLEARLGGCDALVLECNHDTQMLARGDYVPALKRRVGGDLGHLNNVQSAALLAAVDTRRLQHVVAAHLSEKHNTPELARAAMAEALATAPTDIQVMSQQHGLPWLYLQ